MIIQEQEELEEADIFEHAHNNVHNRDEILAQAEQGDYKSGSPEPVKESKFISEPVKDLEVKPEQVNTSKFKTEPVSEARLKSENEIKLKAESISEYQAKSESVNGSKFKTEAVSEEKLKSEAAAKDSKFSVSIGKINYDIFIYTSLNKTDIFKRLHYFFYFIWHLLVS